MGPMRGMWQHVVRWKSQIEWIRIRGKSNGPIRNGHVASEMTTHLTIIFSQTVWGEGKEREKEGERERELKERSSTFSLSFLTIGPLNPGETRGRVDPHYKSHTWVSILWSFDNSER